MPHEPAEDDALPRVRAREVPDEERNARARRVGQERGQDLVPVEMPRLELHAGVLQHLRAVPPLRRAAAGLDGLEKVLLRRLVEVELQVLLGAGDPHARFLRRVDVRDEGKTQLPEKIREGRRVTVQGRQRDRRSRRAHGRVQRVDGLHRLLLQGGGGFDVRQQARTEDVRVGELG